MNLRAGWVWRLLVTYLLAAVVILRPHWAPVVWVLTAALWTPFWLARRKRLRLRREVGKWVSTRTR